MKNLNSDQLDHLAKLWFDIARATAIVVMIPSSDTNPSLSSKIIFAFLYLFTAASSVIFGLILLKMKEKLN
jgi:hypothetical protein